jgi:molecular chaperone GrpE
VYNAAISTKGVMMSDTQTDENTINEENLEESQTEESSETTETEPEMSAEEKLQVALDEAQGDVQKYKDEYIRVHADFENSKKRLEKEKATAVAYSNEAFAMDMLGVLDSLESALGSVDQVESGDDAIAKFKEGLELTKEQMLKALARNGVEEISTEGEFDPNIHQAVMQMESPEHESGQIVQLLQKGYKMKERILRAAMVSTAK